MIHLEETWRAFVCAHWPAVERRELHYLAEPMRASAATEAERDD